MSMEVDVFKFHSEIFMTLHVPVSVSEYATDVEKYGGIELSMPACPLPPLWV
jgi:hypothetical protein